LYPGEFCHPVDEVLVNEGMCIQIQY